MRQQGQATGACGCEAADRGFDEGASSELRRITTIASGDWVHDPSLACRGTSTSGGGVGFTITIYNLRSSEFPNAAFGYGSCGVVPPEGGTPYLLLADTEVTEDGVEQVFGRGFADDFADGVDGDAQVDGNQLQGLVGS